MTFEMILFIGGIILDFLEKFLNMVEVYGGFIVAMALLHKDLKCKAPLIELNLRRNLGKWST